MKLLTTFVILISSLMLRGQNIIIGDPATGSVSVPFSDTILSSVYPESAGNCKDFPEKYFIDLNHDSIQDVSVLPECYMGGEGSSSFIELRSYGDFNMLTDTNFQTVTQHYNNDSLITSTVKYIIPKPYYDGDTIFPEQATSQERKRIVDIAEGYDPLIHFINVDDFVGDTLYIAFRRDLIDKTIFFISKYI